MSLPNTIFNCPYCNSRCQFELLTNPFKCKEDKLYRTPWKCLNCHGIIIGISPSVSIESIETFYPSLKKRSTIELEKLPEDIKKDMCECLIGYSMHCYISTIIMCRRIIQTVCIKKEAKGNNLKEQIENLNIDESLKELAQNIRFLGNQGAHPDLLVGEDIDIDEDDAEIAIEFTEKFLDFVYIIPSDLDKIKQKLPKDK